MGLSNPQGTFHAFGSHAGAAGPTVIIAQTQIPETLVPHDLGNEVQIRDFIATAARSTQDSRLVLEIAEDNDGAPGDWEERAVIRIPDYGNVMRSYTGLIKIKQGQWFRVRFTQGTTGAIECELTGECAVQDLVV